jgi:protein required for attachment to host cells
VWSDLLERTGQPTPPARGRSAASAEAAEDPVAGSARRMIFVRRLNSVDPHQCDPAVRRSASCLARRKAPQMSTHQQLLFVIADGEHVRFVRPAQDNALHADVAMDSLTAHKRSADLGSDHPGASYHSGSSAHHSLTPRHDMHALAKEKFAQTIAEQLNAAAASAAFDELVIVAPPHTLNSIREALDTATDAKIIGTLGKDLVKTPDDELWPHVRHWVRPTHRAKS